MGFEASVTSWSNVITARSQKGVCPPRNVPLSNFYRDEWALLFKPYPFILNRSIEKADMYHRKMDAVSLPPTRQKWGAATLVTPVRGQNLHSRGRAGVSSARPHVFPSDREQLSAANHGVSS